MIKDSGERREFETGAVRDIQEGKGRCDLLPLDVIADFIKFEWEADKRDDENLEKTWKILNWLDSFLKSKSIDFLFEALREAIYFESSHETVCFDGFNYDFNPNISGMILELSKHFEEGAKKYGQHNWERGIPTHCYLDSAVRHLLKWCRGDDDERHDRAFVWNIVCLIWTLRYKPELDDLAPEDWDK